MYIRLKKQSKLKKNEKIRKRYCAIFQKGQKETKQKIPKIFGALSYTKYKNAL